MTAGIWKIDPLPFQGTQPREKIDQVSQPLNWVNNFGEEHSEQPKWTGKLCLKITVDGWIVI